MIGIIPAAEREWMAVEDAIRQATNRPVVGHCPECGKYWFTVDRRYADATGEDIVIERRCGRCLMI